MRALLSALLVLLALAAVGVASSYFIVHQTEQAIVVRFGEPLRELTEPGLYWKIPGVEQVETFSKQLLDIETPPQEVIAADKKQLIVDSFARYRITKPLLFFQRLTNERRARSSIGSILDSSVRQVLGSASFIDVVRTKREQLMGEIQQRVNQEAKDFGIEIIDVRIKRADLPTANSEAIYKRMQTERKREADQFRGEGAQLQNSIQADADRQVTILKAEATRDGETLRGEGDAERNRILAEAFGKDPDFFAFYRSMQAYEQGLKGKDTRILLSPDSEFFKYFGNPSGGAGAGARTPR